MSAHKIIIFDLDGVIVDSIELAAQYTMENFPGITTETQQELLCGNFHEEVKKIEHLRRVETPEETERRKLEYSQKKSQVSLYPGMKDLLQKLHDNGYKLVLNTSALKRNCWPILENHGITSLFDFVADAEVSLSKVEKFKLIEEKYQVKKEDLIFITDTLGDIREADLAGVPTIAVTWGSHDRNYFHREPHANLIKVVDSVEELEREIQ